MCSQFLLPQDIVDHIIDQLVDDTETLKACSLVARLFSYWSRQHLLRRICFPLSPSLGSKLTPLCFWSRSSLSLIQSLRIDDLDTKFRTGRESIFDALRSLPNLTRIHIQCDWEGNFDYEDEHTGIRNRDVLRECCRLPITHLSLSYCSSFPPEELYLGTSLTHLSLVGAGFLPPSAQIEDPRISLKVLYIRPYRIYSPSSGITATQFFHHSSCPWKVNRLEAFGFYSGGEDDYNEFLDLIRTSPSLRLTSLAIGVPHMVIISGDYPPIDLSVLPSLSCLTFVAPYNCTYFHFISWSVSQLQAMPQSNQLRELHLWFSLARHPVTPLLQSNCDRLDNCLTGERFKQLKSVNLRVERDPGSSIEIMQLPPEIAG
ncbi:hypothetical protein AX16_007509 [Volvariella volvacea WC 439]|nr:hypothetical protein AX16_007509 [Volvariella volvacea WC 439]